MIGTRLRTKQLDRNSGYIGLELDSAKSSNFSLSLIFSRVIS